MAIERAYFTGTSGEANHAEVFTWLQTNAAEYFDTIESTDNKITCKVGDNIALELAFYSNAGYLYAITLKNGSRNNNYSVWSSNNAIRKAVKTSCGIWLYTSDIKNIFVSKNTNGGIVMAALMDFSSSGRSAWVGDFNTSLGWEYRDTSSSGFADSYCKAMGVTEKRRTAIVPLCFYDTDVCSENLVFVPYTQYMAKSDIVIDIDGTKYVYNGVFALKE